MDWHGDQVWKSICHILQMNFYSLRKFSWTFNELNMNKLFIILADVHWHWTTIKNFLNENIVTTAIIYDMIKSQRYLTYWRKVHATIQLKFLMSDFRTVILTPIDFAETAYLIYWKTIAWKAEIAVTETQFRLYRKPILDLSFNRLTFMPK